MLKQEKKKFVKNLEEKLEGAVSVVLVNHSGLDVQAQQELKKRLREVDSNMQVVKNTLFKIAAKNTKAPKEIGEDSVLTGPTSIVVSKDDPIAPLQVLYKFAQEFDLPELKVGIVEGSFQDKEALEKLAKLPGKEALQAQTIGYIAAPMYGIVSVLNVNMQKLIFVLNEASKKS